ncbi:hypothetical protein J2S10_004037 [Neobacillus ginsengisoli]|uniref:Uncharacterized protein n=1 Tax=Neobacillus ginsengisoli TaxID=904295 RepID=A0ABT9Y002_9BACI|nr:hypothetical protein [Neobacillus ginsengisoli]
MTSIFLKMNIVSGSGKIHLTKPFSTFNIVPNKTKTEEGTLSSVS